MELYTKKKRWKIILAILGILIIAASLFYTNMLVAKFAQAERRNVRLWADAVHRKLRLVKYTDAFFRQLRNSERQKVELLADVYKRLLRNDNSSDVTFYLNIINRNQDVPVIIIDDKGKVVFYRNLYPKPDTSQLYFRGKLKEEFSVYPPIPIPQTGTRLYYKNSLVFNQLQYILNDYISVFMSEITANSSNVPVIVTDSTQKNILQFGNLNDVRMSNPVYANRMLEEMKKQNEPIEISFPEQGKAYIFYKSSNLLTRMKWFPVAQIVVIGFFLLVAYLFFSASRKSEQNRVWAGMAKETAHQIGTPLSSILAWVELIKLDESNAKMAAEEITKDVKRLEIITERFSKIGSTPSLEEDNLTKIIYDTVAYLKLRSPSKVKYNILFPREKEIILPVNASLFSWVLENLCKNAIDAMNGKGSITIDMQEESKQVMVDVIDTGKGIPLTEQKSVFNPG
ncbi:MAG TPA: HAMP domain-containing histidine kinase, partial [Bacteroidetes bacterium]|nr:HAMP domain-containing histidine kinase [Bacteroidota bacterium]